MVSEIEEIDFDEEVQYDSEFEQEKVEDQIVESEDEQIPEVNEEGRFDF